MYYSPRSFGRLMIAVASWLVLGVSANARADTKISTDKIKEALPGLQKGLASAGSVALKDREILRRIRLDQIVYRDKKVVIQGIYLDYGNYRSDKDTLLSNVIETALKDLLKSQVNLEVGWELDFKGIKSIDLMKQPHVVLQAHAHERNLDELFLATSTFDADGKLQIEGAMSEACAAKLPAEAAIVLAKLKELIPVGEGSAAKLRYSLDLIKKVDWRLSRQKLQEWLAAGLSGEQEGKKTEDRRLTYLRVDRAAAIYVSRFDKKTEQNRVQLEFDLKVVALSKELASDNEGKALLKNVLESQVDKRWDEMVANRWGATPAAETKKNDVSVNLVRERSFLDFHGELQKAVALDPTLDGTLVWKSARYNAAGELELNGICTSEEARSLSAKKIKEILLKKGESDLATLGVNTSKFNIVDTATVLRDLAQWAAEKHDDVRIERLFFGSPEKADQLILRASVPADAKDAVEKKFQELLKHYGVLKKVQDSAAKGVQTRRPMSGPELVPVSLNVVGDPENVPPPVLDFKEVPSLVEELQKILAKRSADPKWRGVLVRRGNFAFENNNRYTLTFIVDKKSQESDIRELVKSYTKQPAYAIYRVGNEPLFALQEVSLDKMIGKLRDVMPVDPIFNGYRVDDALHDTKGNLVLLLSGVGTPKFLEPTEKGDPVVDVRTRLKKMLDEDPLWSLRSRINDRSLLVLRYTNPNGPVAIDHDIGYLNAVFAARNAYGCNAERGRDSVRTALLHSPENSSLWFLSALFYLQEGREELAKRDLYRVVLLEKDYHSAGPARETRLERMQTLEPLQGPARKSVEKLLEKVQLEYFDDKPPMSMKSSQ